MLYVTPERFKTMGYGVDLDGVEDFELRAILRRASDRVNTIVGAPMEPQAHDFRGGTITNEEHDWRPGDGVVTPWQTRIWLWHVPVKTVTGLSIRVTNTQGIDFTADELIVSDRFVDVASLNLTSVGLFGSALIPQVGLAQPRVRVSYTYGHDLPVVGEILEPTDGLLYRAQDQWWSDATVHVYVDDVEVTTGFTIQRDEGAILFDEPQGADAVVTADYTTRMPRGVATATGILAAESLGDREQRRRGMSGLRRITVGEITVEKDAVQRGGMTLVTPAVAEAEAHLAGYRNLWAGA